MMRHHIDWRMFPVRCLSVFAAAMLVLWVAEAGAYSAYEASGGGGNCSQCHPGFVGGFGAPLHDAHVPLAGSNCDYCHINAGDNPQTGLDPSGTRGCAGCHGRAEDDVGGQIAAGLRAHHTNAGAPSDSTGLTCLDCHTSDPNPPVGEDIFPPFFSALGLDPCTDNLDDDGDLDYDAQDSDCGGAECTVDADCDDGISCTLDTCNESNQCANTPDDAFCDDGDVCSGLETCDPANDCQLGTPLVCDDENLCTTDSCDAVAGCVFTPVECPPGEQCDLADGVCKGLPPGCTVNEDCEDEFFCNGAGTCDVATGTCLPGTPVDCDDGIDCTVDTCDEANDVCTNTPDDAACPDDGLFCTGDEVCDPVAGCVSTGDPCPEGTTCNECTDTCCAHEANKVTICHKGKNTISVGAPAVPAHLAHGDTLGPCEGDSLPDDDDDCEPCDDDDNGEPGDDDDDLQPGDDDDDCQQCDDDDNGEPGDDNGNGEPGDDNDLDQLTVAGCGTSVSVPENPRAINLGCLVMVFGALVLWKRSGRRR